MRKFIMLTACFGVLWVMISGGAYATGAVESGSGNLCIEQEEGVGKFSVFFDSAKHELDESCKSKVITDVSSVLSTIQKTNCVDIVGYADKKNSSRTYDNVNLSKKRAEWVYELFEDRYSNIINKVEGGSDASSDGDSNTSDPSHRRVDIYYGQCTDESKEKCTQLIEEGIDVEWDEENQKCVCKKEGFVLNEQDQCVETADSEDRRQEEVLVAARSKSRALIISAGRTLDSIKAGFGKSVWKNKDGGFNTARLASDSIAGVVLGTAGGLITSNVIKKNQIKGGFEDIKCTIGGQVVSDWGDDFRVGIGLNGNY